MELDAYSADRERSHVEEINPTKLREEDEGIKKLTATKKSPWPSYEIIAKKLSTKELLLCGSLIFILLLIVYAVFLLLVLTGPTGKQGKQGPTGPVAPCSPTGPLAP